MKIFWWQGGLHIKPESKTELDALATLHKGLHGAEATDLHHEVHPGPVGAVDGHDQESVVAVHEAPEVVPESGR